MDTNKNYDHQFTKVYKKVKSNKTIKPLEKLILSEIISYQLQGKFFYMTNKSIGLEFGCSAKQAQTAMSRLDTYLDKQYYHPLNKESGKVVKRRKVLLSNLSEFVPPEILLDLKIDFKQYKNSQDFYNWGIKTFGDEKLLEIFLNNNDSLVDYVSSLKKNN